MRRLTESAGSDKEKIVHAGRETRPRPRLCLPPILQFSPSTFVYFFFAFSSFLSRMSDAKVGCVARERDREAGREPEWQTANCKLQSANCKVAKRRTARSSASAPAKSRNWPRQPRQRARARESERNKGKLIISSPARGTRHEAVAIRATPAKSSKVERGCFANCSVGVARLYSEL